MSFYRCSKRASVAVLSAAFVLAGFTGFASVHQLDLKRASHVGHFRSKAVRRSTMSGDALLKARGSLEPRNFVADISLTNNDFQSTGLCEESCFAANYSFSTVPFFTLNQARSVTLSYNGDRAAPKPFVFVLVQPDFGDTNIAEYWLEVSVNGTPQTFVNGDTRLVFTGSTSQLRLVGQFDAQNLATGVYPMTVVVTAKYADGITQGHTIPTELMIVNDNASYIGKGWNVAGLQRLYFPGVGGFMVADGDGSAARFTALGATGPDFSVLTFDGSMYVRTYPDGTQVKFDASGKMKNVVEVSGLTTNYHYDGSGRILQIDDPMAVLGSAVPKYWFNYGAGGVSAIIQFGGPGPDRWTNVNSVAGVGIQSITDPDGLSTSFTYDGSGRLSTVTDRRGGVTTFAYDNLTWKLQQLILPQVPVDAGGGNTTLTNPTITYTPWQSVGLPRNPTSSASPWPGTLSASVYALVTDPMNRTTTFSADRFGEPLTVIDPAGLNTTFTRSGILVLDVQKPDGTDHFAYDAFGRITMSQPAGRAQTFFRRGGPHAEIDSIYGAGTRGEFRLFNNLGQLLHLELTSPGVQNPPRTTEFTYDATTKRVHTTTELTTPTNIVTTYEYDMRFGNLRQTVAPGSRTSSKRFDGFGRDSTVTPSALATSTVLYDVMNRPTSHFDGVYGTPTTFTYDGLFQTDIRDANGNQYHTDFNALGWPTRKCDAVSACETFRYDASGLLTSSTNRRNQMTTLVRDGAGRVTSKSGTNTTADYFSYLPDGRSMVAWNAFEIDSLFLTPGTASSPTIDRTVRLLDSARIRIEITHSYSRTVDGDDTTTISSNTGITFPNRIIRHSKSGMEDSIAVGSFGSTLISQDVLDRRTQESYPTSTSFDHTYTALNAIRSTGSNVATLSNVFSRSYHYDLAGRIAETQNAIADRQWANSYDALGRLVQRDVRKTCGLTSNDDVSGDGSGLGYSCSDIVSSEAFTYDAVGNRTDHGAVVIAGNRYQQFNGLSYAYDADGNVIQKYDPSRFNRQYFWSAENRLDSLRQDSWFKVRYDYNALGQPVRKWRGDPNVSFVERYFVWDGDQILAELDSAKHRVVEYVYNPGTVDAPFAIVLGPTTPTSIRYERQDGLGNVIGNVDNGAVSQVVDYSAWGTPNIQNNGDNHLFWKGLMFEGDVVSLYYMRNRWYDPEDGRFLSEDPTGQAGGINLYRFGVDDPANGIDPAGTVTVADWPDYYTIFPQRFGAHGCPVLTGCQVVIPTETALGGLGQGPRSPTQPTIGPRRRAPAAPADNQRLTCAFAVTSAGIALAEDVGTFTTIGLAVRGIRGLRVLGAVADAALVNAVEYEPIRRNTSRAIANAALRQAGAMGLGAVMAGAMAENYTFGGFVWEHIPVVNSIRAGVAAVHACR